MKNQETHNTKIVFENRNQSCTIEATGLEWMGGMDGRLGWMVWMYGVDGWTPTQATRQALGQAPREAPRRAPR